MGNTILERPRRPYSLARSDNEVPSQLRYFLWPSSPTMSNAWVPCRLAMFICKGGFHEVRPKNGTRVHQDSEPDLVPRGWRRSLGVAAVLDVTGHSIASRRSGNWLLSFFNGSCPAACFRRSDAWPARLEVKSASQIWRSLAFSRSQHLPRKVVHIVCERPCRLTPTSIAQILCIIVDVRPTTRRRMPRLSHDVQAWAGRTRVRQLRC
jgi:hypothetical protein